MARLKKGVWLHRLDRFAGPGDVRTFVRKYADAGFDLLIPCVKNPDGWLDYQSTIGEVRPVFRTWDPLAVLAAEARRARIAVHAWFCVAKEGRGSALLRRRPGVVAWNRAGRRAGDAESAFVCVARPEVRAYQVALMREVLAGWDVDGVHLDYIRTGDDACYCPRCRAVLRRLEGVAPKDLRFWGRMPARWYAYRCRQVDAIVRAVSVAARRRRREVSAAVFSGIPDAIINQGQDWRPWSRRGWVDLVIPMNYTNSPWLMERYLLNHLAHARGGRAALWEGLGRYCMQTRGQFKAQLDHLRRHGVAGVVLFEDRHLQPADFRLLARA